MGGLGLSRRRWDVALFVGLVSIVRSRRGGGALSLKDFGLGRSALIGTLRIENSRVGRM